MQRTTLYVSAIVILGVASIGGVVLMDATQPEKINVTLASKVLEMLTVVIAALVVLLRSAANSEQIQQAAVKAEEAQREAAAGRQELRRNTQATLAISEKLDTVVPPGSP